MVQENLHTDLERWVEFRLDQKICFIQRFQNSV